MTTFPCQVGLICPFCHYDEDGMAYCTFPDIRPKCRKEYQYVQNLEELDCELIGPTETPLGQLLNQFDRFRNEPMAYRRVKIDVRLEE